MIETRYIGNGYSRDIGKELATELYSVCDIVFVAVCGESGEGAMEAVVDLDKKCIGLGNIADSAPGNHIISVMKANDKTSYEMAIGVTNGTVTGGEMISFGIKEGMAGYRCPNMDEVSEELLAELGDLCEKIVSGEIIVPKA